MIIDGRGAYKIKLKEENRKLINDYLATNNPKSIKEIAIALGLTANAVSRHLKAIQKEAAND